MLWPFDRIKELCNGKRVMCEVNYGIRKEKY